MQRALDQRPTAAATARPRSPPPQRRKDLRRGNGARLGRVKHAYGVYDTIPLPPRARSPARHALDGPRDECVGRAWQLVRRIVAALHTGEGPPNYGLLFKRLDAAGHGAIERWNLKRRVREVLRGQKQPTDRHLDMLFDALDADDSNLVVTLQEFARFARSAERPDAFAKPKPTLVVPKKRPRSAPCRRRIRTLEITVSERAAHPATRKHARDLLRKLHRAVASHDGAQRYVTARTDGRHWESVTRFGAPPNQITPARVWARLARSGVADRNELGWRVKELLGGDARDEDIQGLYDCCDVEQRGVVTLQDFAHFSRRVDLTIAPPKAPAPSAKQTFAETLPARPKPTKELVPPAPTAKMDRMARAAAGALFHALAAAARRGNGNDSQLFRTLDAHGQGRLDRDEWQHQIIRLLPAPPARFATDALFDACDTNGTGFVEKAEFATYARSLAFSVAARHAQKQREVQKRPASAPREPRRTHLFVESASRPRRPPLSHEELVAATALFERITRRIDADYAEKAGGFGVAPRDVAYGRVFRELCIYGEGTLDARELARACRGAFLDNLCDVSDGELRRLYRAIDANDTGVVALEDFVRFAKRVRGRSSDAPVARREVTALPERPAAADRARAEAILGRLGDVVARRGGSPGVDDARRGQGANFSRLFRILNPETDAMDRAGLIEAVTQRTATVSADDLAFLFDAMDGDASGLVTRGEFRAFSKRVAVPGEGFRTGVPVSVTRGTAPLPPADASTAPSTSAHTARAPAALDAEGKFWWHVQRHVSETRAAGAPEPRPTHLDPVRCFRLFAADGSVGCDRQAFERVVRATLGVVEFGAAEFDDIFGALDAGDGLVTAGDFAGAWRRTRRGSVLREADLFAKPKLPEHATTGQPKLADRSRDCRGGPPLCLDVRAKK